MLYILRSNNYLKQHGIPMFRKPVKNKGEYRKWFRKRQEMFAEQTVEDLLQYVEALINKHKKERR